MKYMQKHYAAFDYKINKCKLKCIQKSNNYGQNKNCYVKCEAGMRTFRRFVDERINQMQKLLNECVSNANQLPNALYEIYYCYNLYNQGFPHLRGLIREESLYYE